MLDQQFLNIASKLNGRFGTENVGPLLYSMVKLCRPRTVLEVGAGYSTLCILKALMDNVEDDDMERKAGTNIYGKTDYYHQRYDPVLVTLDDYSLSSTLAHKVKDASTSLGLDRYLAIKKADFQGYSNKINPAVLPFDFIWFDCGGLDEYINFTNEYWALCNPNGGIIVFHSTQTNLDLKLFIKKIEELQDSKSLDSFEVLSMLEPHKKIQNSISIIRKTSCLHSPLYTIVP